MSKENDDKMNSLWARNVEAIAAACHQQNRAWCIAHGDDSQPPWHEVPEWQRWSAIHGVEHAMRNPDPRASHENWLRVKREDGWVYGETKDASAKTHPCMVPYDDLPPEQRAKDALFVGMVGQLQRVFGMYTGVMRL